MPVSHTRRAARRGAASRRAGQGSRGDRRVAGQGSRGDRRAPSRPGSRRERNPYATPRSDRRGGRGSGRSGGGPSKQSGAGIASAICGGSAVLCFLIILAAVGSIVSSAVDDNASGMMAGAGVAFIASLFLWLSVVAGIILGFIGLMAEQRKKGLAVTGLIINGTFGIILLVGQLADVAG